MAASIRCQLTDAQWGVSASPALRKVSRQTGHVRRPSSCQLDEALYIILPPVTDNDPPTPINLQLKNSLEEHCHTPALSVSPSQTHIGWRVTAVEVHLAVLIDLIFTGPDCGSREGIVCSLHVYSHPIATGNTHAENKYIR